MKKKGKKKSTKKKKKVSPVAPQLVAETGLRSRQYLNLQVEDQRDVIDRLQHKLKQTNADLNALVETGGSENQQLSDDREYFRREGARLTDALEHERIRAANEVVALNDEINALRAKIKSDGQDHADEVANLTERITGLIRKLEDLEHYREEQTNIKAQLMDAELQLRQAEQSHQQQLDELERATRANEAFLYKETEQKLARVARSFRAEATANLDDRSTGALSHNKELSQKVSDLNQKLFGVVSANKNLELKADATTRELTLAEEAKDIYAKKYRKSQKVITRLRDSLNEEKDKVTFLEDDRARLEAEHRTTETEMARHIEVLQSTIGATGEVLDTHEARVSKKGLPEASIKYFREMMDWAMTGIETRFIKRCKRLGGDERAEELATQHQDYKRVLLRVQEWGVQAAEAASNAEYVAANSSNSGGGYAGGAIQNVRTVGCQANRVPYIPVAEQGRSARRPPSSSSPSGSRPSSASGRPPSSSSAASLSSVRPPSAPGGRPPSASGRHAVASSSRRRPGSSSGSSGRLARDAADKAKGDMMLSPTTVQAAIHSRYDQGGLGDQAWDSQGLDIGASGSGGGRAHFAELAGDRSAMRPVPAPCDANRHVPREYDADVNALIENGFEELAQHIDELEVSDLHLD